MKKLIYNTLKSCDLERFSNWFYNNFVYLQNKTKKNNNKMIYAKIFCSTYVDTWVRT